MESTILVIDGDRVTRDWLIRLLSEDGYQVFDAENGEIGLKKFYLHKPNLVILETKLPDINGEFVINKINEESSFGEIPTIIFSNEFDKQKIAKWFELGIADFVPKKPGIEKELLGKCSTSLLRARSSIGQRNYGKLISFFSAKGGIGTSTLCLNLAYSFAKQVEPKRVLVVDLVLPIGSLAIMTGVEECKSIASLSNENTSNELSKLHEYLFPIEDWKFSLLPGSFSIMDGQKLDPSHILPIIRTSQSEFDYVIVDLGKTLSKISFPVIENSDALGVVISPDFVTTELTQIVLNHLEDVGIDKDNIFLLLNRAVGREGLSKREIEERISHPIMRTIPYARDNFTIATNNKRPFAVHFPRDTLSMELNELAGLLLKFIS